MRGIFFVVQKAKNTFSVGPRHSDPTVCGYWICVCFFFLCFLHFQFFFLTRGFLLFSSPALSLPLLLTSFLPFYCLAPADCSLARSAAVAPPASAAPGRSRAAVAGSSRCQSAANATAAATAAGQSAGGSAPAAWPIKGCSGAKCSCPTPSSPAYPISTNPAHCPGTHNHWLSLTLFFSDPV